MYKNPSVHRNIITDKQKCITDNRVFNPDMEISQREKFNCVRTNNMQKINRKRSMVGKFRLICHLFTLIQQSTKLRDSRHQFFQRIIITDNGSREKLPHVVMIRMFFPRCIGVWKSENKSGNAVEFLCAYLDVAKRFCYTDVFADDRVLKTIQTAKLCQRRSLKS